MKAINPHSLMSERVTYVMANETISKLFASFKSLAKDKEVDYKMFDVFMAGFFVGTNHTLREEWLRYYEDFIQEKALPSVKEKV